MNTTTSTWKALTLTLCAAALGGCATTAHAPSDATRAHELAGARAPSLDLPAVAGDSRLTLDGTSGKVTIVAFWSSDCRSCAEMLRLSQDLARTFPRDLAVVAVSADGDRTKAAAFAKKEHLEMPLAWDDGGAAKTYASKSLPSVFVVGRDGQVRTVHSDFDATQADEIVDEVADLVAEKGDEGGRPVRVAGVSEKRAN